MAKVANSRTKGWKKVSDRGSIWAPEKAGEEKIFEILSHTWALDGDKFFPVTLAAEVDSGEVFSLRTDKVFLSIVQRIPHGGQFALTYRGLGEKRKGKNPAQMYDVMIAPGVELAEMPLLPERNEARKVVKKSRK